ncbi:MAG TPA: DUF4908 domain-containing protein [Rhizomicrobium sp.]|jgi:hypothetical protein|nr:DUF4908 domain-containing protein [Rhizomicrobium sp.]
MLTGEGTDAATPETGARHSGAVRSLIIVRAMFAILLLAAASCPALAQNVAAPRDPMSARLSAEKVGDVETGAFSAGDNLNFTLDPYGDKYLLRLADSPERYVLTVERIFLGGRILHYDTGATALRVSVWGGMTLYTASAPDGLPATRIGDDDAVPRDPVSHDDLVAALADEESHLAYTLGLHIRFSAEPAVLAAGEENRGLAFDALVSAESGIERLVATPGGRQALAKKFDMIRIVKSDKPGVTVSGKTLTVSFVPSAGAAGRASSRQVAQQLGKMLQVAEAG